MHSADHPLKARRLLALLAGASLLVTFQGCNEGLYVCPDDCSPDRTAAQECFQASRYTQVTPCTKDAPYCYAGSCIALTPDLVDAAHGVGPYEDPCKANCEHAAAAKCSQLPIDFLSACETFCATWFSEYAQCDAELKAMEECTAVAISYGCTEQGTLTLGAIKQVALCDDTISAACHCTQNHCESYADAHTE